MRSKAHAYHTKADEKEQKKLKDVTKKVTKTKKVDKSVKWLKWDPSSGGKDFNESVDKYVIGKESHELYLQRISKIALNAFDDKRKRFNIIKNVPWS